MEIVVNTEYQDIYRITSGVLLIINKFFSMYPNKVVRSDYCGATGVNGRKKLYDKNTSYLHIQQVEHYSKFYDALIPKGTVLYCGEPVVATQNKDEWTIYIKTSGDSFSGNISLIEFYLSSILQTIKMSFKEDTQ